MSIWGDNLSHECILPVGNPSPYFNEDQRNVHVWMSQYAPAPEGKTGQYLHLLAGAYAADPPALGLSMQTLYSWIRYICYPKIGTDSHGRRQIVDSANYAENDFDPPDTGDVARRFPHLILISRFKLVCRLIWLGNNDPRQYGLPTPQTYPQLFVPRCDATEAVRQGHYILVEVNSRKDRMGNWQTFLSPCNAETQEPAITQRAMTRGVTATNTKSGTARSAPTRRDVRLRDMCCRVTGQAVPERQRGLNFTGLEVAHVFPLGGVAEFKMAFDPQDANTKEKVYKKWSLSNPPKSSEIDIPANAFVLRADIHAQFDSYEFGIEYLTVRSDIVHMCLRCFEKSGAPSLRRDQINILFPAVGPPIAGTPVAELDKTFLTHHYLTGVLWHVAGNGRPNVAEAITKRGLSVLSGHAQLPVSASTSNSATKALTSLVNTVKGKGKSS